MAEKWRARKAASPKYWPEQYVLDGPGLTEMVRELLADLAHSILDGDERAEAWADYLVALGNLRAAEDPLTEPAGDVEYLADRVSMAWDRLEPELGSSVYLKPDDVRQIQQRLGTVTGRAGTERRAA